MDFRRLDKQYLDNGLILPVEINEILLNQNCLAGSTNC